MTTTTTIEELILQTDASGAPVRLEYVRGRRKVEASPASRHQKTVRRIERSIMPTPGHAGGCACYELAGILIRFPEPDGSLKRPDSAKALDVLPRAVVEILSVGKRKIWARMARCSTWPSASTCWSWIHARR